MSNYYLELPAAAHRIKAVSDQVCEHLPQL